MLHRRLLVDDGLGVMEALNETEGGCGAYDTRVNDWASLCAPLPPCTRSGSGVVVRGVMAVTLEQPQVGVCGCVWVGVCVCVCVCVCMYVS